MADPYIETNKKKIDQNQTTFKKLQLRDLDDALQILDQEPFASHDNHIKKTDLEWLTKITQSNNGYAFGLFLKDILVGIIFAENLIDNGVILWLIATHPDYQSQRFGTILLVQFHQHITNLGKKWIFLNSTEESNFFYKKNEYALNPYKVYECFKFL